MNERMPPLSPERMSAEQKSAAAELAAGPRGGVRGPFIALLRSPQLMNRLQKVSRHLTQQFEWQVHYPLALSAGLRNELADALAQGARRRGMSDDEEATYDFCTTRQSRVWSSCRDWWATSSPSLVMNVAHTPAEPGSKTPLEPFPS